MKVSYEAVVHNKIENVFDFVIDFNRRPEWVNFVGESYLTKKTDNWIGSTYKERLNFLKLPLALEYEIIDYQFPSKLTAKCQMPPFHPILDVDLTDNNDGTIHCYVELNMKLGPLRWIPRPILRNRIDYFFKPAIVKFSEINNLPNS